MGVDSIFMHAANRVWIGNCNRGCAFISAVFATLVVVDGSRRKAVNGRVRRVVFAAGTNEHFGVVVESDAVNLPEVEAF